MCGLLYIIMNIIIATNVMLVVVMCSLNYQKDMKYYKLVHHIVMLLEVISIVFIIRHLLVTQYTNSII